MTNKPVRQQRLKSSLGAAKYFRSLLANAQTGLKADVRAQTVLLAEGLAQRMTFGASGSVKAEAAQSLIESAMYCIGYRLKSVGEEAAYNELQKTPVRSIWKQGRDMIRQRAVQAKSELEDLRRGPFSTKNRAYNDTLSDGLPEFFKLYDADFAAHETPGLLDYPLSSQVQGLLGIEYIAEYLRRLAVENGLCSRFAGDAEALLACLGRNHRETHVNIYDMVLTNAAGRILCAKGLSSLDIGGEDRERLKSALGHMKKERLISALCAAAERVCFLLGITDERERSYARAAAKGIAARVMNALVTDSLGAVFLEYKKQIPPVQFTDGRNMDDDTFRAVAEELRLCRHVSDKLAIIKRNVNSVGDLADILGASCLCSKEYEAVFETLDGDMLALLFLRLPEDGALHVTEAEREWHAAFSAYTESRRISESIRERAESIRL